MFLTDSVEKCSRRIGSIPFEQCNVKNHFVSGAIALYNQDYAPLILTAVSSTTTRLGVAFGGSEMMSDNLCTH